MQTQGLYRIQIRGHLDQRWADWFEGMTITHEAGGTTMLFGPIVARAALHDLLTHMRDLGLTLVSVNQVAREGD